jgi:hypothetical protein
VSAPERVRNADGVVWERRAETRSGLPLYAVEGVCKCPAYVMATLAELAEHGVQSSELAAVVAELGALPMPVGSSADEAPIAYELTEKADDVRPQVRKLRALLAGQRTVIEDPNGLHHDYRLGRDLPETGGAPC